MSEDIDRSARHSAMGRGLCAVSGVQERVDPFPSARADHNNEEMMSMAFGFYSDIKWFSACVAAAALGLVSAAAQAVTVPFTETFSTDRAGWVYATSTPAIWQATGGVDNGPFISGTATPSGTGFGTIVFRGNDANDASGDAFVGNWITGGVKQFSAYVRHDATSPVNFYFRFDRGLGAAGSSNVFAPVLPNTWTKLTLPIEVGSFQSFGGAGNLFPGDLNAQFNYVFSSIANVQIATSTIQESGVIGNAYTFGLAAPSVVPEPSAVMLVLTGLGCGVIGCVRRRRSGTGLGQPCLWKQRSRSA